MSIPSNLYHLASAFNVFASSSYEGTFARIESLTQSSSLAGAIEIYKFVAFVVSAVAIFLLVVVFLKMRELHSPQPSIEEQLVPPQPAAHGPMTARWEEVVRHMESAKEAEWKFALIEADKLADDVLRRVGFPGETMGERLLNIQPGQLQSIQGLWQAHKVRNRIAHEMNYFLRYSEAKQAIEWYAQTLRELEAI